jgi:alkylation response protein AidB-like acyl-CoA dehydrogenase
MSNREASRILSRRDLDFLLFEWLGVERFTDHGRYADHSRETFDSALDLSARLAAEQFYPINKLLDREEPHLDGERIVSPAPLASALAAFSDAGLMAAAQDAAMGGMQLPHVVSTACFAWFQGASCAAAAYPMLTMANANLLIAHGSSEQVETWVRPMLEGRFFGTMCLSEPQAGSSLSDIRTKAVPQPDGSYRLFGNKMWISGGDQDISENIVHLVLAKIPAANGALEPGTRGISLFLVPKILPQGGCNDVVLGGLNHKMGYRGITNCLLYFGEGRHRPATDGQQAAGAVGWLVGERGQGLKCMFHMMNEARVGVGLGATMLGYSGYLHALDYARTRTQGRPPNARDPAAPQIPIIGHADVRRMLLAQKAFVEGALALILFCASLVDDRKTAPDAAQREDAGLLLDLLTPVAKSWPSQWCLEANNLAIQVHGGYGYTRDFNVEQLYRDNRLNPIHEGTHGVQALDLLGRKVRLDGGRALTLLGDRVARAVAGAGALGAELAGWGAGLEERLRRIVSLAAEPHTASDPGLALANATPFLEAFGHVVVAWVWLEQACAAHRALAALAPGSGDADFYRGKHQAARYFFGVELPKVDPMFDLLQQQERSAYDMKDAWF